MSQLIEIKVPDIGDYKDVPVIEVHIKPGDTIEKEQSLVTLESDKATMDVPSSHSGVVKEVKVKVGDSISEGSVVLLLEGSEAPINTAANTPAPTQAPAPVKTQAPAHTCTCTNTSSANTDRCASTNSSTRPCTRVYFISRARSKR